MAPRAKRENKANKKEKTAKRTMLVNFLTLTGEKGATFGEIQRGLGVSTATISNHLKELRTEHSVVRNNAGVYSLAPELFKRNIGLFRILAESTRMNAIMSSNLRAIEDPETLITESSEYVIRGFFTTLYLALQDNNKHFETATYINITTYRNILLSVFQSLQKHPRGLEVARILFESAEETGKKQEIKLEKEILSSLPERLRPLGGAWIASYRGDGWRYGVTLRNWLIRIMNEDESGEARKSFARALGKRVNYSDLLELKRLLLGTS